MNLFKESSHDFINPKVFDKIIKNITETTIQLFEEQDYKLTYGRAELITEDLLEYFKNMEIK